MNNLFDELMRQVTTDYGTVEGGDDHDVVLLRRNGCIWPTDGEIIRLLDILNRRAVYNKLEGQERWRLVGSQYAVDQMIQGTPMALLDRGHINMYWEFGGFYPAREFLRLGGFIESRNSGFMEITQKTVNYVAQSGDELHEIVLDELGRFAHKMERHLIERVQRYDLVQHMMRLTYRCTREANFTSASLPPNATATPVAATSSEQLESLKP